VAKNFVIFYNGREGSSAIISALSGQAEIRVPLFEELDPYIYKLNHRARDLPDTLDQIFETGSYRDLKETPRVLRAENMDGAYKSIGFKWRIHGDIPKVAEVLRRNNVTVFALFRRSFLNVVCSSYVHAYGNKIQSDVVVSNHPQFEILSKSEAEVAQYFDSLNQQKFKMVRRWFLKTAKSQARFRHRQAMVLRMFAGAGVKQKVIFYEDFDARPAQFIANMKEYLGLSNKIPVDPYCGIQKVHKNPISERIQGIESVFSGISGRIYQHYKRDYKDTIARIEKKGSGEPLP